MSLDITITDMFCGAGGSSTGAVNAGATIALAINHWPRAIETHNTNHPDATHVLTDITRADPRRYPSTTILIASPECTCHTLAKGKQRRRLAQLPLAGFGESIYDPAEERSRATMWDPLRWAEYHHYPIIILENVVDARFWVMWDAWVHAWDNLGYDHEIVYLNSMFAHPTPQSRDRMYFVAWKRGNRKPDLTIRPAARCAKCGEVEAIQCWKNSVKRAGKYKQQYVYSCPVCLKEVIPLFYPAATAIDWTRPIQRIGDRLKPLKEKTLLRIASGLEKFADHPFSIPMTRVQGRLRDLIQEPFPTQTATETQALVMSLSHGVHPGYITPAATHPLLTQTTRDDVALVTPPFLLDHIAEYRPRSLTQPISTIVGGGNHQSLVVPPAYLMSYYQTGSFESVNQPVPTVTTLERCALVTPQTESPRVENCGFRMLEPHEIQAAMAFPASYIVTGTRREKVKQLGNAVTPPVMELLMRRCLASLTESGGRA